MSKQTNETTTAAANVAPPMDWTQAVEEAEASRVERVTLEDVIDVKLTETDLADIARANAADDHEKTARQRKVDDLKSDLKDEKTSIDALVARMHDRNNAVLKGVQARKAAWIVETIFATNTVRYLDPTTERVVLERPISADERQVKLPLVDDAPVSAGAQMSLGDVDDQDADGITDPDALLEAAQAGDDEDDLDEDDQ